jgi:stage V sporulation protein AD
MLTGHRTWLFENQPVILSSSAVGGPFEANGPLADDFDLLHGDMWLGQDSFEKAQTILLEESCQTTISKAGLQKEDIQFFFSGDLTNQITSSNFAARTLGTPYLGIFGACSTTCEGLALAAYLVNTNGADYILTGAVSHNAVAERQFRYPTEYGAQKPPTAQWTVTGAGTGIITSSKSGLKGPRVTSATIGKVVDMGLSDPMNMGGAMAPAAVDTIEAHLKERNVPASYYDLIITGDLAHVGREISLDLFKKHGIDIDPEKYRDCGILMYREGQPVLAGGSGAGCSASVLYGHLLNEMHKGTYKRILIVATGALLSQTSVQQK